MKEWLENIWDAVMQNPEQAFKDSLRGGDEWDEKFSAMILNIGNLTTLSLTNISGEKFLRISLALKTNTTLENLSVSCVIDWSHDLESFCNILSKNKNLALKSLDLSKCEFRFDFRSLCDSVDDLLQKKEGLTLFLSKEAFKEKALLKMQESPYVKSGRLIIQ